MTRMERRRRRARRRRIRIFVAVFVFCAIAATCTSFTEGGGAENTAEESQAVQPNPLAHEGQSEKATAQTIEYAYLIHNRSTSMQIPAVAQEFTKEAVEPELEQFYDEQDVIAMAQMVYGEAWVTQSDTEMSWSMWSACNRLDSGDPFYANCETIYDIITQEKQYHGYDPNNPVEDRLVELAKDVLERWSAEKRGETDVGRTLPAEFLFFYGDGKHNHFTTEFQGGVEYDGYLGTPYDS